MDFGVDDGIFDAGEEDLRGRELAAGGKLGVKDLIPLEMVKGDVEAKHMPYFFCSRRNYRRRDEGERF